MLSILASIVGLAPSLLNVINRISDLKIAQLGAKTEIEKATINAEIEEVHDKRAALVAEVGNKITAVAVSTLLIAFGLAAAIVFWKLTVWDHVIGSLLGYTKDIFTTDPLDSNFWWVTMAIVGLLTVSKWK